MSKRTYGRLPLAMGTTRSVSMRCAGNSSAERSASSASKTERPRISGHRATMRDVVDPVRELRVEVVDAWKRRAAKKG
ncbi:hypothetical protein [Sandaracinus amylolyticus]|uniref:hypothetical protein n=1 Tax=Sandaracinus amylolyticus TaxID=927083 RepID=UPI001F192BEB|nr:hypothetical protein [Sandaracinus amylolyticus]